jgi:hypothetical protein
VEFRHCDVSRIHDDESRTVLRSFVFQYGPDPRRRHVEQRAVERHREADVCSLMEEFAISFIRVVIAKGQAVSQYVEYLLAG